MRDTNLQPLPLGTPQDLSTKTDGFEFYLNDTWRPDAVVDAECRVSATSSSSRREKSSGSIRISDRRRHRRGLNSDVYIDRARARRGCRPAVQPAAGLSAALGERQGSYYNTDWSNLGPRLAATWNPPGEDRLLGTIFKRDHTPCSAAATRWCSIAPTACATSCRSGMGFGENLSVLGPRCNANGTSSAGCDPAGSVAERSPTASASTARPPFPHPGRDLADRAARRHGGDLRRSDSQDGPDPQLQLQLSARAAVAHVPRNRVGVALGRELPQAWVLAPFPTSSSRHRLEADVCAGVRRDGAAASQRRAGGQRAAAQPWFENQLGAGQTARSRWRRAPSFIDGNLSALWLQINQRRIAAGMQPLSDEQIQTLWARGDGGKSFYHAFYTLVRRRMSNGLTFNASYTLSAAKDEAGVRQNIDHRAVDGIRSRRRLRTVRVRSAGTSSISRACTTCPSAESGGPLAAITGGWYVAGIFSATSGIPLDVCQRAGAFGGGLALTGCVGAIRTGRRYRRRAFTGVAGSNGIGTSGNPATGGTGVNMFENPEQVFNDYRRVLVSQDERAGRGTLRGLPRWNLDIAFGKRVRFGGIDQRHVHGGDRQSLQHAAIQQRQLEPGAARATFGVITSQANTPRQIQLGMRVEF